MVARLLGAPSFPAQGMLGQARAWWAMKHGCLWGRQAVPPQRGRGGHASGPFSTHPSRPARLAFFLPLLCFPRSTHRPEKCPLGASSCSNPPTSS